IILFCALNPKGRTVRTMDTIYQPTWKDGLTKIVTNTPKYNYSHPIRDAPKNNSVGFLLSMSDTVHPPDLQLSIFRSESQVLINGQGDLLDPISP
ncbi:hypothetical protein KP2612_000810, partial [Komagataella phaffii]